MSRVTIRLADADDLPRILDTLRLALGETPTLRRTTELWSWKHVANPFGRSIVLVAESQGQIAGVRAMMRWQLDTTDNDRLNCLRPVDTATHPDFTRQGIFQTLTLAAVDLARSQGVDLVFNTPNDKSAPGYLKMGWKLVGPIGVLVRPRFGSSIKPSVTLPPSIDQLAPRMRPMADDLVPWADRAPLGMRTPRTSEYLKWRFNSHPTAGYGWATDEKGGLLIARAGARGGRSELIISELLGSPSPSLVRRSSRTALVRYVAGWFSNGTPERSVAKRGGMIPVPGFRTLKLVALPLASLGDQVFDLRSWDLSTGDLELL